jgi:predicted  nucleic acid-binding Zn-ribbon protein
LRDRQIEALKKTIDSSLDMKNKYESVSLEFEQIKNFNEELKKNLIEKDFVISDLKGEIENKNSEVEEIEEREY